MALSFGTLPSSSTRFHLVISSALRKLFLLAFLLNLSMGLLALVMYFRVQPVIPIFYTLALPSQQLAAKEWIFLFPALAFGFTSLHLVIAHIFREYSSLLLTLFGWVTVGLNLILGLSMVRIIWII